MKIITDREFDVYWKSLPPAAQDEAVNQTVKAVINAVREEGDEAVRRFASRFDKSSPPVLEVPFDAALAAGEELARRDPELSGALAFAAQNIRRFAERQKAQFFDFEFETVPGLIAGQKVIPVRRAAVYAPAGRFPLISSVLMGLIPAFTAGVEELILSSPPLEQGLPGSRILAAAAIAAESCSPGAPLRIFAMGGAQAIAALALGTQSVPRADLIAGPGNKYVAAAKRLLSGETGIDLAAGPTDVLVIADDLADPGLIAADLLAQAEHDGDARARVLVPAADMAEKVTEALEGQLALLPTADTARSSLDAGGLIVVYRSPEEGRRIANAIAPEHLELQVQDTGLWLPFLRNFGSLFIGKEAAEVLGDYSAGINHTLPTSGSARWQGGLSVRHFLKTPTTLRAASDSEEARRARKAAEIIARAEGLYGHALSARMRGV
jgi:histidinol dehydrogenase